MRKLISTGSHVIDNVLSKKGLQSNDTVVINGYDRREDISLERNVLIMNLINQMVKIDKRVLVSLKTNIITASDMLEMKLNPDEVLLETKVNNISYKKVKKQISKDKIDVAFLEFPTVKYKYDYEKESTEIFNNMNDFFEIIELAKENDVLLFIINPNDKVKFHDYANVVIKLTKSITRNTFIDFEKGMSIDTILEKTKSYRDSPLKGVITDKHVLLGSTKKFVLDLDYLLFDEAKQLANIAYENEIITKEYGDDEDKSFKFKGYKFKKKIFAKFDDLIEELSTNEKLRKKLDKALRKVQSENTEEVKIDIIETKKEIAEKKAKFLNSIQKKNKKS